MIRRAASWARVSPRGAVRWALTLFAFLLIGGWGLSGSRRVVFVGGHTIAGLEAGRVVVLCIPAAQAAGSPWTVGMRPRPSIRVPEIELKDMSGYDWWILSDFGSRWRWRGGCTFAG